jgi:hypothetical protein
MTRFAIPTLRHFLALLDPQRLIAAKRCQQSAHDNETNLTKYEHM